MKLNLHNSIVRISIVRILFMRILFVRILFILAISFLLHLEVFAQEQSSKAPPLSPEDFLKATEVQPGYKLVPVLTEPHIHEPSVVVWDGNGRMYVAEMRTYMQDIDGKNQLAATSRVSRHEDTDGDGVYDKHTVFADKLALPRMILPLLDRVIIRETNTLDLKSYQDTDDDGVADKIEMWHKGGNRGGNLEHQPSGLIWNIDNWLYTTYSNHRYRFTNGTAIRETLPSGSGQWGLTHDDVGRVFYSTAGGENPAMDFQRPLAYGKISLPGEQADGFREVFPIDSVPDTQGGRGRLRANNTLNHFTASCGQSIYRGDRLPSDTYGDLFICEPVGRLIRRAKVTNDRGKIIVSNAYDKQEFIASRDPNFRPTNSATGPDGCLYIVDMYRGIIQEGNWVRNGSYLRGIVQQYELEKNIGRGRIYRVDHETTKRGPQPRMLDQTPQQLVAHLSHVNGWWRSESQKLIILHGDASVVPALDQLASSGSSPLGRLHALWTLEGLNAVSNETLLDGMADSDERVRAAALRIAEMLMAQDRAFDERIRTLSKDKSPEVVIQTLLSVTRGGHPDAEEITNEIITASQDNPTVSSIANQVRSKMAAILTERKRFEEMRRRNAVLAESMVHGKTTFTTLCITCHGPDGKGLPSPDKKDLMLAPPLAGSPRVLGHKERLTRILLNGLIGPVDGKSFSAGLMLPMGANDDQWIADVANYVRNTWGNKAPLVEASDVERIREGSKSRVGPWTLRELNIFDPPPLDNRSAWKLSSSLGTAKIANAIDGNPASRWDSAAVQRPGMWFQVELLEPTKVLSLTLNTKGSNADYPRGFFVQMSNDGKQWSEHVADGRGTEPITVIELNSVAPAKFIRITQSGSSADKYWSIHELTIKGLSAKDAVPLESLAQILAKEDLDTLSADARKMGDATQGALLFYNQTLSCAKCHDPQSGDRLGPDLASKRDGVNDTFLVRSVLHPSKDLRKGFEQITVETEKGLVFTGFRIEEDKESIVIREPAGGKKIKFSQQDVFEIFPSKVSAMPPGLVNQLNNRKQFLDLARFLMEANDGGPSRLEELKKAISTKRK